MYLTTYVGTGKTYRRVQKLFEKKAGDDDSQFPCSWIQLWIRIPNRNPDPDPGKPNQCVSMTGHRMWPFWPLLIICTVEIILYLKLRLMDEETNS